MRAVSWIGRVIGVSPIIRNSAVLYRHAIAELVVADTLGSLGAGWAIVHEIGLGAGTSSRAAQARDSISHVAVGANGVFAVTTVNVGGEPVWVASSAFVQGGVRMHHLRDAEYNALRLSQRLFELSGVRVEIMPAVVVATPRDLIINRAPRRVSVLTPSELVGWVRSHSSSVATDQLSAVASAAVKLAAVEAEAASTRVRGSESIDEGFDRMRRVRKVVHAARRVRIAWVAAGLVGVWVTIVSVALYRSTWA